MKVIVRFLDNFCEKDFPAKVNSYEDAVELADIIVNRIEEIPSSIKLVFPDFYWEDEYFHLCDMQKWGREETKRKIAFEIWDRIMYLERE